MVPNGLGILPSVAKLNELKCRINSIPSGEIGPKTTFTPLLKCSG